MTLDKLLPSPETVFQSQLESIPEFEAACSSNADVASFHVIGSSEEGRPIAGIKIGTGDIRVSLVAGAHSDEPVGPETLRHLVSAMLSNRSRVQEYFDTYSFFIVPHVNPDGEARNLPWIKEWPSLGAYLEHVFREKPGRDVEFNYPDRRVENRIVSEWLRASGPFSLHMSLHGMGFSDGAMLLIEKNWTYRTEALQSGFIEVSLAAGLRPHDHNRKGEKGFFNIAPGFTTTPEGAAMRTYFLSHDDPETAALFGDSSMEFIRSLGGDPLCLVTELPLFLVEGAAKPGVPAAYLEFKRLLPELRLRAAQGLDLDAAKDQFGLSPLPITSAIQLQLAALELGLRTVSSV